jgi:nicotinate-nucleotide pyrophosphorylase
VEKIGNNTAAMSKLYAEALEATRNADVAGTRQTVHTTRAGHAGASVWVGGSESEREGPR